MITARIKICGITRLEDAMAAVELGAQALGFVFWPKSPRLVTVDAARSIARQVPALVTRVGVFVNQPPDEIASIVAETSLDAVQLHGDERVEDYGAVGARIVKAVTLDDETAASAARDLADTVTVLVDAVDRERRGGTGRRADWVRAAALSAVRPVILAGGLTPHNVAEAIRTVRPWALDVSSGVEDAPGIKNVRKLRELFAEAGRVREEDR